MAQRFLTTNATLVDRIKREAEQLRTVQQLRDYAREVPSPVVGELLRKPLDFFMVDCRKEDGRLDWKKVKARRRFGMGRRLYPADELTPAVCKACLDWILCEGRDIGTGFLGAMVSQAEGGISDPRYYAQDLLRAIAARSEA